MNYEVTQMVDPISLIGIGLVVNEVRKIVVPSFNFGVSKVSEDQEAIKVESVEISEIAGISKMFASFEVPEFSGFYFPIETYFEGDEGYEDLNEDNQINSIWDEKPEKDEIWNQIVGESEDNLDCEGFSEIEMDFSEMKHFAKFG